MSFPTRRRLLALSLGCGLWLLLVALAAFYPRPAQGAGDEPTPEPTSWVAPDLYKPVIPDDPLLADLGAVKYWGVCMACHGDRGQGLTDEWRERGFGEDMNCWQSRCHSYNHPSEGFQLVRVVPPAVGSNTLRRFTTAAELQAYLVVKMPWWNPNSLTPAEAWQLTAFLLRENGVYPRGLEFQPQKAAAIPVHLPYRAQTGERLTQWLFFATLSLATGLLLLSLARLRRSSIPSGVAAGNAPDAPPVSVVEPAMQPVQKPLPPIVHHRPNFLHHLHPPTIPFPQARWRYTLGMGGLAVFLTLLVGVTGALEMFFYIPTPAQAGSSIQEISFLAPFGGLVRGLHFWGAQALVIVSGLHLLRILFTGAYAPPRRFNFLLGLALFVLALLFDFTGYVLRWDEGIRWALMVGTNLLKTVPLIGAQLYGVVIGGVKPGLATLTRFYAWHIFGLTLFLAVILVWHLFRVRRDGGISAPPPELRRDPRRITRYDLAQREGLAMLLASLALIAVSLLWPAPLAAPIQEPPVTVLGEVRAPWFFLWIQQLLRYGDAFWLGVALPLGVLVLLAALPYLFPRLPDQQRGRWFPPAGRAVQIIGVLLALGWLALTLLELATKTP